MPSYSRLQGAVVASTVMCWAGYAEAFIDVAWRAKQTREWIDVDPPGSAAMQGRTPEQSLASRAAPGAHADLRLDDLRARLAALDD